MEKVSLADVRKDFPMLGTLVGEKPLLYLDNAATTLKPKEVIERLTHFYSHEVANVHRGSHYLSDMATTHFEEVRRRVMAFLAAENEDEILFTKGTTESINLAAATIAEKFLSPGDEILVTDMEHHSNIVPWYMVAKRLGVKLLFAPIDERGELILEEFKKCLRGRVKVVAMTHCSNTLGTLNDLKPFIQAAKKVGALVLIDGAQGIAKEPVNLQELGCDLYAFSAHKLYGPFGLGVLYGKRQLLQELGPYQGGGGMIEKVAHDEITYTIPPMRFEAGTPNVAGVLGLGAALEYLQKLGWEFIREQEQSLSTYGFDKLSEVPGLKILGRAPHRAPIFTFTIKDLHAQDLATLLDQQGIAVRAGHHCTQPLLRRYGVSSAVRASFCFYNTREEVDGLVAAIVKAKELLS